MVAGVVCPPISTYIAPNTKKGVKLDIPDAKAPQ